MTTPVQQKIRDKRRPAQQIADMLAETDIKGILNFAPSPVRIAFKTVKLRNVFFTAALDNLVYYLSN